MFATLFTDFVVSGYGTLSSHVTQLRPEVVNQMARTQSWLMAHGVAPSSAKLDAGQMLGHRVMVQANVLGFDRVFLLQGAAVPRRDPAAVLLAREARRRRAGARRDADGVSATTRER